MSKKEIVCPLCVSLDCYTYPEHKTQSSKLFNCRKCGCKFTLLKWKELKDNLQFDIGVC